MRPFFSYYGGKWRMAPKYPTPKYSKIIEPFAGSAGYSTRLDAGIVDLYDVCPSVGRIWQGLLNSSAEEILNLPVDGFESINELDVPEWCCDLIGYWVAKGRVSPARFWSPWGRQYRGDSIAYVWGRKVRERIASQLEGIFWWSFSPRSYETIENEPATWFIDPPYQGKCGRKYTYSDIDYTHLADWCLSRKGQIIVCEIEGANWLPFETLGTFQGTNGKHRTGITKEVIFHREN